MICVFSFFNFAAAFFLTCHSISYLIYNMCAICVYNIYFPFLILLRLMCDAE